METTASNFHNDFTEKMGRAKTISNSKADGSDFLKVFGDITLGVGVVIAVLAGMIAVTDVNFSGMGIALIVLVSALFVYGFCRTLASINNSLHRAFLLQQEDYRNKLG